MNLFSSHGRAMERLPTPGGRGEDQQALSDLAQAGFLRPSPDGRTWTWASAAPYADRLLLGLLSKFDLHLQIDQMEDSAAWLALVVWEQDAADSSVKTGVLFSGTGLVPADAVRSCLGEFAEFQSWLYRPGDGDRRCQRDQLDAEAIDPWRILGFADEQRLRWRELNEAWRGYDSVPEPGLFDGEVLWSRARKLADESECWVPARLCHGRYAEGAKRKPIVWRSDSNGCAAGRSEDHALANALLELVERDATGIWWYGRIPRPAVPQSLLEGDPLAEALAKRTKSGQRVRLLDLTNDLEIPVVAAILGDDRGQLLGLGFACAIDKGQAVRSAYLEMCQMELLIKFAKQRVARDGAAALMEDRRLLDWLRDAAHLPNLQSNDETMALSPTAVASNDAERVALILDRLRRAGLETFSLQLRRPDIGIPAVRAFVPGLCHYKPRLGHRRLVEVPTKLGWKPEGFRAADLNSMPLLI